jgi:hypothetical protein
VNTRGPFPDFSSPFWENIDAQVIASEDLVSKIHTIELLEQLSPFRGHTDQFFQRVWRSIDDLQRYPEVKPEWLTAALVVFGNTLYFPQALLDDAWRSLYIEMVEAQRPRSSCNGFDFQIFENDPSGMGPAFCHLNRLQGRLDHERYPRVASTDELADLFLDFLNPLKRADAAVVARRLLSKQAWAILVDKTLSGHSLSSDIDRMLCAYKLAQKAGGAPPEIIVLCQVMTDSAERVLHKTMLEACEKYSIVGNPPVTYHRAVLLDRRHNITSDDTALINDKRVIKHIRELSRWFAGTFIAKNPDFDRMRDRSGDDLRFGYRGCGLTISDYDNCPTDSLPLLWYLSEAEPSSYRGPYVRIHSRIGPQLTNRSIDKWASILGEPKIVEELARAFREQNE